MEREFIQQIVEMAHRLDARALVNTYEGNISIKDKGLLYITPSGKRKASLTEEMITVLDENGEQIGGKFKASSELLMHMAAYRLRSDVHAVIHCHSPYLTAYALCNKAVETKSYAEVMMLFKTIPVVPYGRPGTDQIHAGFDPVLKKSDVVLLANHGVLAVEKTLEEAFAKLEAAEAVAKVLTLARQIGDVHDLPVDEVKALLSFGTY